MFSPNPWKQDFIWQTSNAPNNPPGCMEFKTCENLCKLNSNVSKGKCVAFNHYDDGTCGGSGVCEFLFKTDVDKNAVDSFSVLGLSASSYVLGPLVIMYASAKGPEDNTLTSLTKFKNATLGLSIATFVILGLIIKNIM